MAAERWATFDCYGTLIDWEGGLRRELERLFDEERAPSLLERFHELEPEIQAESYRSYRDVLTTVLERLAEEAGVALRDGEATALADSLPRWDPFPDVGGALDELRARGWRLAILSNSDRDLIAASQARLGLPFDHTVVAEDVGSYKPAHAHWERFFADTVAAPSRHVHVAASHFHDIAPARRLGLTCVWVNRLGERASEPRATRELRDLSRAPDVLDELVA